MVFVGKKWISGETDFCFASDSCDLCLSWFRRLESSIHMDNKIPGRPFPWLYAHQLLICWSSVYVLYCKLQFLEMLCWIIKELIVWTYLVWKPYSLDRFTDWTRFTNLFHPKWISPFTNFKEGICILQIDSECGQLIC